MIEQLRQRLRALEKPAEIADGLGVQPLGVAAIDAALGGGLARGALHEIAAVSEAHFAAATGFALRLAALRGTRTANFSSPLPWGEVGSPLTRSRASSTRYGDPGEGLRSLERHLPPHPTSLHSVDLSPQGRGKRKGGVVWIAEDMALAESGAPYGPGLDAFGLAPERLLTVSVARRCDLLWAMEEALHCRAVGAVIGEVRDSAVSTVALRRLSLAAVKSGVFALLLRASPTDEASTAATRWIVGAASSVIPGRERSERTRNDEEIRPRLAAQLVRNRRGPLGAWILEWSDSDERFLLATPAQPVAAPALDRPHRKVA